MTADRRPQTADLRPRIVTEEELVRVLLPYIQGYPWAYDALRDLWRMGAPTPDSGPGVPERRILLPSQFRKWWEDVRRRMGYEMTAEEVLGRLR